MDQINNHSRVWCPLLDFLFYLTSRCQSMFQLITDFAHFKNKGSFPTCAPLFSLSPWSFLSHLSCLLFFTLSGVKLSPQRSSPGGQSLDKKPLVNNINVAKDVVSLQTCHVCKTILNSKDCVTANNVDAIVLL